MKNVEFESPQIHLDIFALAKLYKGSKSKALEMNESLRDEFDAEDIFEEGEILEVFEEVGTFELATLESAAAGVLGAGVSFAIYKALKEILSLEGSRRRGEVDNAEVIERVSKMAWKSGKKGVVVGAILGGAVMIFGNWVLMPLVVLSPFLGIQMVGSLWQAFWKGLDDTQKQELKGMANQLGGRFKGFLTDLDHSATSVSNEGNKA